MLQSPFPSLFGRLLDRPVRRFPRFPRFPLRRGFSLVEVLVVIIVIGVAAAMTLPRISSITNQTKIQRAAQALQMEIQQAYAISGRNRAPVTIKWNSGSMQLQITDLAGTTVYRRASLGSTSYGLSASEVTVTPTTLAVFPNGLAADTLVIK